MVFCRVCREAHLHGATLYVAGVLHNVAAEILLDHLDALPVEAVVIRLDIRAVVLIDPRAFVRVARALNAWRDERRGRGLRIEFPDHSKTRRRALALHIVDHHCATPSVVSTATRTGA
jgi:predicted thioesterase